MIFFLLCNTAFASFPDDVRDLELTPDQIEMFVKHNYPLFYQYVNAINPAKKSLPLLCDFHPWALAHFFEDLRIETFSDFENFINKLDIVKPVLPTVPVFLDIKTITAKEANKIFKEEFGEQIEIYFFDWDYISPELVDLQNAVEYCPIRFRDYKKDRRDCDGYAIGFKGWLALYGYDNVVGIVAGDIDGKRHMINIAIVDNKAVLIDIKNGDIKNFEILMIWY